MVCLNQDESYESHASISGKRRVVQYYIDAEDGIIPGCPEETYRLSKDVQDSDSSGINGGN